MENQSNNITKDFPGFNVQGPVQFFPAGRTLVTLEALESVGNDDLLLCLCLHVTGDWGEVSRVQVAANNHAVNIGGPIRSEYKTDGGKVVVIETNTTRQTTIIRLAGNS